MFAYTINHRAADIEAAYTFKALAAHARQLGFVGDQMRYSCITEDGRSLTGKAALAYWVAANNGTDDNTQRIEPITTDRNDDTMPTYEQTTIAQAIAAPAPTAAPQPHLAPVDAAQQLLGLVQSLAGASLDEEKVRAIVAEALAKHERPAPIMVKLGDLPATVLPTTEHRHPLFEKVLRLIASGLPVLLVGPAGTGKTTLAHQVATALSLDFGALHCTAGASESQLLGWLLPVGDQGRFEYRPAQFARLYKQGNSLFLLDEIDASDPNFLMVLNGALANGHLHVPQNIEEPSIPRGLRSFICAAANTHGTGSDMQYAGRNQLDAATLDRFYIVHIDYDRSLERSLTGRSYTRNLAWAAAPTDEQTVATDTRELADWLDLVREKAAAAKLRRVISTRAYIKAATARAAGVPTAEIRADLLAGWTRDELAKVA